MEHLTGFVKGLLTSKLRISKRNTSISRLELVGGQMAANMVKNLLTALEAVAYYFSERVDGQHGCVILDLEPRKSMENIRIQSSEENC